MAADKVLSFVDTTKPEKRFNNEAFQAFVESLSFRKFLSNPYEGEACPLSISLDTVSNPVCNGFFSTDYMDKFSYVRIRAFDNTGVFRVYMKDVDAVIDALTKVRDGFNAARETGLREFPKPVGFDEWAASQNDKCVPSCYVACN